MCMHTIGTLKRLVHWIAILIFTQINYRHSIKEQKLFTRYNSHVFIPIRQSFACKTTTQMIWTLVFKYVIQQSEYAQIMYPLQSTTNIANRIIHQFRFPVRPCTDDTYTSSIEASAMSRFLSILFVQVAGFQNIGMVTVHQQYIRLTRLLFYPSTRNAWLGWDAENAA